MNHKANNYMIYKGHHLQSYYGSANCLITLIKEVNTSPNTQNCCPFQLTNNKFFEK